jgi:hypothetical protein
MKKSILLLLFTFIAAITQGQVLRFPFTQSALTVDGKLTNAEWQMAKKVRIDIGNADSITVWYQYSSNALHFAFVGKLESSNMLFPEVLLDPQYQRTGSWINGQWWFHVSATDCEHNGGYGVYTNCQGTQPGWQAAPNFAGGAPMTDTVEIAIPFSKVGLANPLPDTMGIAFLVTNTATIFNTYPHTSDRNVPATWSKAVFEKPTGISNTKSSGLLYPNPVHDKLHINLPAGTRLRIFDIAGKLQAEKVCVSKQEEMLLTDFKTGMYLVCATDESGRDTYTTILKD